MRRFLLLAAFLLVWGAAAALPTQQSPSKEAAGTNNAEEVFKKNGIKLWPEVLRIAGVDREMRAAPARYAALIPTDAAVAAFLKQMGLTTTSLADRPQLAKHLVRQHLVLALPPDAQQALVEGKLASVPTAATAAEGANQTILRVVLSSQGTGSDGGSGPQQRGLRITDTQGHTAAAVKVVRQDSNKVAIIIDRVLMSGQYYPNFASLCKQRAAQAGVMCEALTLSGTLQDASSPAFANTVFMPGPKAFQRAGIQLSGTGSSESSALSQQQLSELVKYHVVPGVHAFPDGFQSGASYATMLPGASLKIQYDGDLQQALRSENSTVQAYVVPASGQRVPVVVYNVFVGQGIVQGIPTVLLPPAFKSIPAQPAPTTAAERGQPATSSASGGRQLLASGVDTVPNVVIPFNAAETAIRSKTRSMFKDAEERWG